MGERSKAYNYTLASLIFALAVFISLIMYYGFSLAGFETVEDQQRKGQLIGAVLLLVVILGAVAANPAVLLKRDHRKHLLCTSVCTYITAIMILGLAFVIPSYTSKIPDIMYDQCTNTTGYLWKADLVYDIVNTELCQVTCPCNADPKDWSKQSSSGSSGSSSSSASSSSAASSSSNSGLGVLIADPVQ
jgi:hypothetical protein